MIANTKHDVVCVPAPESAERQPSGASVELPPVRIEDFGLARLRRTLDQIPDAVSWQEMRSRILAALSDLPDEPRFRSALAPDWPSAFQAGGRGRFTPRESLIGEKQRREAKSRETARSVASRLSALFQGQPLPTIVWILSAVLLAITTSLLLYHPSPANILPPMAPRARQASPAPSRPPEVPPTKAPLLASAEGVPAALTAVQPEFTSASASVAIALTAPVDYEVHRLANPERLYIDFHNARLAPELNGRNVIVRKPCLLKYRLVARAPRIVRIAFETGTACSYSARLTAAPSTGLVLLLQAAPPATGS